LLKDFHRALFQSILAWAIPHLGHPVSVRRELLVEFLDLVVDDCYPGIGLDGD
jgi:hypothetical protein